MTHLNGLYTFDQQHRLYEPVRNLLTLTASVGVAALVVQMKGDIQERRDAIALSQQFNLDIYLPMAGVLRFAVEDRKPRTIQIAFKKPFPRRPRDTKGNADFPAMFVLAAATAFANFYEAHRDWMESKAGLGQEVAKWPAVLNFGRVVRNFIAHSGKVYFKNENATPVSWHHLTYSYAHQGRKVIGTELDFPELIILLVEMSEKLDELDAPVLT